MLGLIVLALLVGVADAVFRTVLYHWASGNDVEGIETDILQGALGSSATGRR